jgi:branched-chain amino acid transport system ATP-binding protein
MLALARVLLGPNRLLVIDEPTKGLAPKVAGEVAAALLQAARLVPILLVEQNLAVVRRMARDAVVLDVGRVVHTGGARDLLADPELTNRLLGVAAAPADTASADTVPANPVPTDTVPANPAPTDAAPTDTAPAQTAVGAE